MCRALPLDKAVPGEDWPSSWSPQGWHHNISGPGLSHPSIRCAEKSTSQQRGLSEAAQVPRGSRKVLYAGKRVRARTVWLEPRKESSWNKNAIPQTEIAPNPAGFFITICLLRTHSRAQIMHHAVVLGRRKHGWATALHWEYFNFITPCLQLEEPLGAQGYY